MICKASIGILLEVVLESTFLSSSLFQDAHGDKRHTPMLSKINLRSSVNNRRDSAFHAVDSGFQVTGFRIFCQLRFRAGFQSLRDSGFFELNYGSPSPEFRIPRATFRDFRNPDYLTGVSS